MHICMNSLCKEKNKLIRRGKENKPLELIRHTALPALMVRTVTLIEPDDGMLRRLHVLSLHADPRSSRRSYETVAIVVAADQFTRYKGGVSFQDMNEESFLWQKEKKQHLRKKTTPSGKKNK